MKETVPDACPKNDDGNIGNDHQINIVKRKVEGEQRKIQIVPQGGNHQDGAQNGTTLGNHIPHVNIRLTT